MTKLLLTAAAIWLAMASAAPLPAAPTGISFKQSATSVDAYDFVEVTINVTRPDSVNPFTDPSVTGGSSRPPEGSAGSRGLL